MTSSTQINDKFPVGGASAISAKDHDDKIKGAASAVSLSEIEELFATLDEQQNANEKKKPGDKSGEEKLLGLITELLNEIGGSKSKGGSETSEVMTTLKGYSDDFYKGDNSALPKILSIVMPAIMTYAQRNPNDLMSVIKALAPLMKESGENVIHQVERADYCFTKFQEGYKSSTDPNKQKEINTVMKTLLSRSGDTTLDDSMDLLNEQFTDLLKADSAKGQKIIGQVFTLLAAISVKDPKIAKEFAQGLAKSGDLKGLLNFSGKELSSLFEKQKSVMNEVLAGNITPASGVQKMIIVIKPTPNPVYYGSMLSSTQQEKRKEQQENTNKILAEAMMALQMLQSLITESQTKQDEWSLQMSAAKNKAAAANAADMDKKIDKEVEAERKAHEHHWWDWLIKAIVALVAVIVAAVTAGVGAAIAACLIGVFMATPLMNMTVSAIAKKISADVYNKCYAQYKAEGKSDAEAKELAQQKADAIGNFIGQLVCIIAVVVLSFGVGGIEAAGEDAADTALEEGTEMTDFAADTENEISESVEESSSASKFNWNGSTAGKMAAFQGLGAIGGTNIWMSAMQMDPEWCKKNKVLMMIIDVIAELITIIAAALTGNAAMGAASEGASAGEVAANTFAKYGKFLLGLNALLGGGQGAYGAYTASMTAKHLKEAATLTREIGEIESELTQTEGQIKLQDGVQQKNLKTTQEMIKNEGSLMDSIEDVAGTDGDTVNRVLARA